jgi:putative addiction module CopG family antidote
VACRPEPEIDPFTTPSWQRLTTPNGLRTLRMAINIKTRNDSLTPEIEAFINDRVASGRFRSASEVVRAALRLLEEDERRRESLSPAIGRHGQPVHVPGTREA